MKVLVFLFNGAVKMVYKHKTKYGCWIYTQPNGDVIFSGSIRRQVVRVK